jgi:hypothetical protein
METIIVALGLILISKLKAIRLEAWSVTIEFWPSRLTRIQSQEISGPEG